MKKYGFLYFFLGLVSLIGCNEKDDQKITLNFDQLNERLKSDPDYSRYIISKANNIVIMSTLSEEETEQLEFLESDYLESRKSTALISFYYSIGYDINELDHLLKVKENLSAFLYKNSDLFTIAGKSTFSYLQRELTMGVISLELSCSMHCTEVADRQFASELEGSTPGSIDYLITKSNQSHYYRGCYHECVRYQD